MHSIAEAQAETESDYNMQGHTHMEIVVNSGVHIDTPGLKRINYRDYELLDVLECDS